MLEWFNIPNFGYTVSMLIKEYGSEDRGLIPGRVIPKIFKTVLDTSLFNTQQYQR